MKVRPDYLPTRQQIAIECAEIRRQWTPAELRRRTVGYAFEMRQTMWFPPTIDTASCTSRVRRIACEQSA
jgi:hypothetical protein